MNFQTNRIQHIDFAGEEPTDFSQFTSASQEDEESDVRELWIAVAVVLFVLLAASFGAGWVAGTFF